MNFRERFLNDLKCNIIVKGDQTFSALAKLYGYPEENGTNLCKKDYYKFKKDCQQLTSGATLTEDAVLDGSSVPVISGFTPYGSKAIVSSPNNRDNSKSDLDIEKLTLRRAWEAQTPNGIQLLKSYQNDVTPQQIKEFRAELLEELKNLLELEPVIRNINNKKSTNTKIFFISDLHIGMDADNWSVEAAKHRVLKLLERLQRVDKVIIANLGDTIDGLNQSTATKSTHTLPQNLSNSKQIIGAVDVFKILFDNLDNYVKEGLIKEVEFYSVSDSNHSGDMELVISDFLKLYLNTKYPYVKVNNSDDYWNYIKVDEFNILMSHGKDSSNMKHGLPLNPDYKVETYLTQLVNNKRLPLNPETTLIVSGDLHTESFNQCKFFKYYKMPALSPASKWVKMNYGDQVAGLKYLSIADGILEEGVIHYGR